MMLTEAARKFEFCKTLLKVVGEIYPNEVLTKVKRKIILKAIKYKLYKIYGYVELTYT